MTKIHMEIEITQATIQAMQRAVLEMDELVQQLKRTYNLLEGSWQMGNRSSKFFRRMNKNIQQLASACRELDYLDGRLSAEMWQWIEVDAQFSDGNSWNSAFKTLRSSHAPVTGIPALQKLICGSKPSIEKETCEHIWSQPPSNAQELAYMTMNLPESMPIVIMQIGEGEYLVLLGGTVPGKDEGHNWGSAIEAMFGNSSYQNSIINALNKANIPAGATLNFAGHSQGGMVSQNLAVDPRVTDRYEVESVYMFGSPDTFSGINPKTRYVSYEAPGDIVPHLDDVIKSTILSINKNNDDFKKFHDVSNFAERHIVTNTPDAFNPDPYVSHMVYDNPNILTGDPVPFGSCSWDPVSTSGSEISTLGPKIYKGIMEIEEARFKNWLLI